MTAAASFGLTAGLLQAVAYIIYVLQVVRAECRPNGMTWIMWSCGTLVLLIIEWDVGAPVSILILPAVCSFCSLFVAGYAFARGAYIAPERQDWVVLGLDVMILAGYIIFAHGLAGSAGGDADQSMVFVSLTGATTLTSSWPNPKDDVSRAEAREAGGLVRLVRGLFLNGARDDSRRPELAVRRLSDPVVRDPSDHRIFRPEP